VSNASCGRAKWPDGGSASGTQLVPENRFDSTAEADRLIGCISGKAALQQNATKQRSSVRALLITPFFCGKAIKCPLTTYGLRYGTCCMVNVALRLRPLLLAPMSALGQTQTCAAQKGTSALPPKADMCNAQANVCLVPAAREAKTERPPRRGLSE